MASERFGATGSHSSNERFEYPVIEERMKTISEIVRDAENLPQTVVKMFKEFGLIRLYEYDVFDLLVGKEGNYPLVNFRMDDGMNGWLLLPKDYGEKHFVEQEIETINSVFKQLMDEKVVVLGGETSTVNQLFMAMGDLVTKSRLDDGSEAFYLNSSN